MALDNQATEANTQSQKVDNLDKKIGSFFPATEVEQEFVGDQGIALGTLRFRKAKYEDTKRQSPTQDTAHWNNHVLFSLVDDKLSVLPINVFKNQETGEVTISGRTAAQFEATPGERASDRAYVKNASKTVLARACGVPKLPEDTSIQELIESNLVESSTGTRLIPVLRRHHGRNNAKVERLERRENDALNGSGFTAD